jgi:uncharacterized protein
VWFWKKTDRTGSAHAGVPTDRPERYGKQLVSHLGRHSGGEWSAEDGSGWIALGKGRATVTAAEGMLELTITAPYKQLANLEKVVGSHLERFGERDALRVAWNRAG